MSCHFGRVCLAKFSPLCLFGRFSSLCLLPLCIFGSVSVSTVHFSTVSFWKSVSRLIFLHCVFFTVHFPLCLFPLCISPLCIFSTVPFWKSVSVPPKLVSGVTHHGGCFTEAEGLKVGEIWQKQTRITCKCHKGGTQALILRQY